MHMYIEINMINVFILYIYIQYIIYINIIITYFENNHMRSYELKSHLRPGISFAILSLSKFYVAPR